MGRPSRLLLLVSCALLLCASACSAVGSSEGGAGPPVAAKIDQLTGVYLAYAASAHDEAARDLAITQALTVLGVDLAAVQATIPSASGQLVAQRITAEVPDLKPLEALIAQLYTLAVYGVPSHPVPPEPTGVPTDPPASGEGATS